ILRTLVGDISGDESQGIFLWGPPGIGKSALVKQLALEKGRPLVDIRLPLMDPVDLRGLPMIDKERLQAVWLPPDFLPPADSPPGILFLDEINAAPPAIQASAYQLILDKGIGTYKLPKGWIVIAAGNRVSDRSVAYKLPSALANRFTHLEIDPNITDWIAWAWKNSIDPMVISFLKLQPHLLTKFDPKTNHTAFPSPRSWVFVSKLLKLRDQNLVLYMNTVKGTVGEAASHQFLAFLNYRDEIPDPEDILSGEPYDIPTQIDAQYVLMGAIISALLGKISSERITSFFAYVSQFENTQYSDYAVVVVKEALNAFIQRGIGDDIMKHKEFDKFLERNAVKMS
ncbi:MAG: MoxR family ATPase, partial [Candidatus Heimdallarchaeota archaeon]|nr:MoxR family ATPase [Candidatus Heimdallarchaeota archaeon]